MHGRSLQCQHFVLGALQFLSNGRIFFLFFFIRKVAQLVYVYFFFHISSSFSTPPAHFLFMSVFLSLPPSFFLNLKSFFLHPFISPSLCLSLSRPPSLSYFHVDFSLRTISLSLYTSLLCFFLSFFLSFKCTKQ